MVGGVCALDVDRDGKLDLFIPGLESLGGSHLWMSKAALRFADEGDSRGVARTGESVGCVGVDLDGDEWPDLLTTGVGGVRLYANDHGRFLDVSSTRLPALLDVAALTTAAVAFDADGDGDLDLAVASYGHLDPSIDSCPIPCEVSPSGFVGGRPWLWLQGADGRFIEASDRLPAMPPAPALVLLATDLDDDGRVDLFVGNDLPHFADAYLTRDAAGSFIDKAVALGVARSAKPSGLSSMSATDPDIDGDGHLDLLESSYDDESDAAFVCSSTASSCTDLADSLELWRSPVNLRWGQAMVDFDDDGALDLIEAAGHVLVPEDFDPPAPTGKRAVSPVFWHRTGAVFARDTAMESTLPAVAGRGLLAVDLDDDGDLDVVIASALGSPVVLENVRRRAGHHVDVRLEGRPPNRSAVGARITVSTGDRRTTAMVHAGHSYLSSCIAPLHFGVGDKTTVDISVRWPDGSSQQLANVVVDTPLTIKQP